MRADRVYRLLVGRGGLAPALLADPSRVDKVELVDIARGEVVLHWDASPRDATRLIRRLRADLAALSDEELLERWNDASVGDGGTLR